MASLLPQASKLRVEEFDFGTREELGSGGAARVFSVLFMGQKVAVKVPHWPDSSEVDNLVHVSHKNIARFFGTVDFDNRMCIVLELAKGSASDILKDGPMSLMRTSRIAWINDVARGMRYLHSEAPVQLIHGDLKGSNVLIFDGPRGGTVAKVADFDQARPFADLNCLMSVRRLGTLLWTAPEVLTFEGHSKESDVWSFGCTVVELISENEPYHHHHRRDDQEINLVIDRVKRRELNPLIGLQADWPPRFFNIACDCLKFRHQDRPSFEDVLRHLTEAPPASSPGALGVLQYIQNILAPPPPPPARMQVLPNVLHCRCKSPRGAFQFHTLYPAREATFGEALTSVRAIFHLSACCVCFSLEGEYLDGGECRSWIKCRDLHSGEWRYVDQLDGRRVNGSRTRFTPRLLDVRSELPPHPCPRLAPFVDVLSDAELLQMAAGRRTPTSAPEGALRGSQFVAFLCGVRRGAQLFWSIAEAFGFALDFFLLASPKGESVLRASIPGASDEVFFFLLLKDGDRLPAVSLPDGHYLTFFSRLGATVDVQGGRLVAPSAASVCPERWEASAMLSDLCRKVSAAADTGPPHSAPHKTDTVEPLN